MTTQTRSRRERRRKILVAQLVRRVHRLIYVARLGEHTIDWHAVEADYLGGDRYRIVGHDAFDEGARLEFQVGQIVCCEYASHANGRRLVAVAPG